jgi:nuclear cap-binding protein subunit 1
MARRNKAYVQSIRVWHSDNPHPQEDYLDCLWAQISKLKSDKWVEHHIIRVYHAFGGTLEQSALQHNLPQFMPPGHEVTYDYPYPTVVFRLFDYTDCPEGAAVLPGSHSIERFLAEEDIRNTMDLFYFNRKDAAKNILQCPVIQRYPMDYMIVEVILGEMFRLPKSKHLEIFYGSLLIELCKAQAASLPMVLAQAVVLTFDRLATMNGGCIDRFSSWFAYHLSNFQFMWTWSDWESEANLDYLHPKSVFIRETLLRCMRFSYHHRIVESVPETFGPLIPVEPKPIEKFSGDDLSNRLIEIAIEAKTQFRARKYDTWPDLDNLPPIEGFEGDAAKVNLIMNVLMYASQDSFTHLFTALGKSANLLGQLITTDETQAALLHTLYEVWKNHQQLVVIVVQKIIKYGIVDSTAVIDWVFSAGMRNDFHKGFIWEMIHNLIKRKLAIVKEHQESLSVEKEKLIELESESKSVILDNPDEIPSEESVEKIEEQLEASQLEVKSIIQLILSRLLGVMSQHIRQSEAEGKSFKDHWFRWTVFRLQEILFQVSYEPIFMFDNIEPNYFFLFATVR